MTDTAETNTRKDSKEPGRLGRLARWVWGVVTMRGDADAESAVAAALDVQGDNEVVDDAQRDMIMKAVRFARLKVEDVMAPRASIMALDIEADLGAAARAFAESQHSRLPVYRDTMDDPLGFVHVKDILALLVPDESGVAKGILADQVLPKLRRDILFVPAAMRLPTLLIKMQATHIHLALVVDEYGGTDGIVSIEDIVEQIVGDIEDEHDEQAALVQAKGPGIWEADARADIEKVASALGVASLGLDAEEDEFDTLGGLASALAGRLPVRGEVLTHPAGFDFEVLDADPRRVKRLRIRARAKGETA